MSQFDPEKVKRSLWRLDLGVFAPLRAPITDYTAFYGLNIEDELPTLRHYFGYFESLNFHIAAHAFVPENALGTVFILHGYLDHAGLYSHVIKHCVKRGFAVFIYDLPGHGLSSGLSATIDDFEHYQDVLVDALNEFGAQLPKPFYAIGQSTGAGILMDYTLSTKEVGAKPAFNGLLLLAPLVRPAEWRSIRFGYWLVHRVKPTVPRVFRNNSNNPEFLNFLKEKDPLQTRAIPMQWVGAMRKWSLGMLENAPCDFPVILVQGALDETVDWRFNNAYVKSHFTVRHYVQIPQASHHLANEREDLRKPMLEAIDKLLFER